jgi:hypothetical protein
VRKGKGKKEIIGKQRAKRKVQRKGRARRKLSHLTEAVLG